MTVYERIVAGVVKFGADMSCEVVGVELGNDELEQLKEEADKYGWAGFPPMQVEAVQVGDKTLYVEHGVDGVSLIVQAKV